MSSAKKLRFEKQASSRFQMQKKVGNFLREQRSSSGVSILELAQSLDVDPEILNDYELGIRKVPLNHVYGIANFLNIPPEIVVRFFNQLSIEI